MGLTRLQRAGETQGTAWFDRFGLAWARRARLDLRASPRTDPGFPFVARRGRGPSAGAIERPNHAG